MKKSKVDLAKRLNRSRKRKYDKFLTSSLYLTIILVLCYLVYLNLPWSFHLFVRWVTKGGDLDKIPAKFYAELNQLCLRADSGGEVRTRNYREHTEIAESLGTFRCTLVNGGQEWLIEDYKSFSAADEAILGTQLAVFITEILGTDYSYRIRAYIPNTKYQATSETKF
ncbi:hypothetical protein [Microcystis aeruginosa]|uniref:hypothetical protein n=1 Tax=Microcystis aeruginosa TaxID=1126 RepID=UPI0012306CE0|nr:hypothetical protein [Microcystis aeruginosa]GCA89125.1 hypothetical protein MiTa_02474 [Microcystis aeruginosa NIES-4264]